MLQIWITITALLTGGGAADDPTPPRWGSVGHEMAARTATTALPSAMPAFFRGAADQLVYLDSEPDRWRNFELREMDQAWSYDHYVDLENVPDGALDTPDRFEFLKALYDAGLEKPERDGGFLPYRIIEVYQRVVTEWRMWRSEDDTQKKQWIEARILNDAGILGHYVTDASQPHHTTIHFNGWSAGAPNPEGFSNNRSFHSRFESAFVEAHVTQADVDGQAGRGSPASVAGAARAAVWAYIEESHSHVVQLYRLDRDIGFDPSAPLKAETRDFAASRLAAGADMLADLWWSAWLESGDEPS
ncbi:MAG: hypothetical protein MK486_12370 [Gemmatimonadetes bacterium]|jgi:hypothetical protein|nr:hypothetical protein [Gemmatimonadota bacterium]